MATRLFSERGFDLVSIDVIATAAGISKQTFYSRFHSKETVITAVIRHGVTELLEALTVDQDGTDPIDARLIRIATELVDRSLDPAGLSLNRLVSADMPYAPRLALAYYEHAFVPARDLIAQILADGLREERHASTDMAFVAEQFLHAVVGGPARIMILSGRMPRSRTALVDQVSRAVRLFLDGVRVHAGTTLS